MAGYPLSAPFVGSYPITPGQGWGPCMNPNEFAGHGYPRPGTTLPVWHSGIDYGMPSGVQLYAMADGEVIHASLDEYADAHWGYNGSYGLVLKIAYDNGYFSLFAHQSSIEVSLSDRVVRGQPVSHSGGGPPQGPDTNSGNSFGTGHLHLEIRAHGGGPGTDIDPLSVTDFSGAPTQTAPTPPLLHGNTTPGTSTTSGGGTTTTTPSDTSGTGGGTVDRTQLPLDPSLPLKKVRPYASSLSSVVAGKGNPIMACELDGTILPVMSADVTLTTYKAPGSFSLTLSLSQLARVERGRLLDVLTQRQRTQVILSAAFVADVLSASGADLLPIFTGFAETPHFAYNGPSRILTLSGPDMSGLLSAPSSTESNLQQFQNQTSSQVVRTLAARHGLDSDVDTTTEAIGGYFDSSSLKTRTQGQTEWDIVTQLAQSEGFVAYVDGTTLRFGRLPSPMPPTVQLRYDVAGEAAGPVLSLEVDAQPHSKRDYAIVVQSFDTRTKTKTQGSAGTSTAAKAKADTFASLFQTGTGNPDAINIITITKPPNTQQKQLDTEAAAVLAIYQSTEYLMTARIRGALPIYRFSPLSIVSDTVYRGFQVDSDGRTRAFYPAQISYSYTPQAGFTMNVISGNRPYGVQSDSSSTPSSGSLLGG